MYICKYFLDSILLLRDLRSSLLGLEFTLKHLNVVNGLQDDLELRQLARLLKIHGKHLPQVLHICCADVADVKVKFIHLDNHDEEVFLKVSCGDGDLLVFCCFSQC